MLKIKGDNGMPIIKGDNGMPMLKGDNIPMLKIKGDNKPMFKNRDIISRFFISGCISKPM